jgi:hypothetical protein
MAETRPAMINGASDGWSAKSQVGSQLKLDISALTLAASQAINTTIPFKPIL